MSRAVITKQPSVTGISFSYEEKKERKMELTQREVDVQTVQVPRGPFGLEDLRGNGVTARPPDDCTSWSAMHLVVGNFRWNKKGAYM